MMQSVGYDIASSEHRDQINTLGSRATEIHLEPKLEQDDGVDFHSNIYRINDRVGNALERMHSCVACSRRVSASPPQLQFENSTCLWKKRENAVPAGLQKSPTRLRW